MIGLEILETIASVLTDIPKLLQEYTDRRRRKEFVKACVICYFTLLDIVTIGEILIGQLEGFTKNAGKQSMKTNEVKFTIWRLRLKENLIAQSANLIKLAQALSPIQAEIRILNPQVDKLLEPLIISKGSALMRIAHILETDIMGVDFELEGSGEHLVVPGFPGLCLDVIPTLPEWNRIVGERIRQFLAFGISEERLSFLSRCADQIRSMLVEHFTIEDILWSVDQA